MPLIKRKREEQLVNDIVVLDTTIYFLGIPIYQDVCYSTSLTAIYQFVEQEQPTTGLYDVNNVGFKQENVKNT